MEKFALELQKLMTACREVMTHLPSRTETKSCVLIDRASLVVYKHLIVGILFTRILKRWIEIPCSVPKYFFRVKYPFEKQALLVSSFVFGFSCLCLTSIEVFLSLSFCSMFCWPFSVSVFFWTDK